ncbi:maleylpyruvate isomerase family mycothiol-dependent enzyme [Micromonospora sp. RTP1Z1]|uniref:maleylpyruvate isomerase family mycothiol-dependent enzyme n=1 Tax=Micromonospora sp. RTP1Z1 TaxID=2994043 RepID=UPI0029C7C44F|nr:maleylpyruvate isomerase family mycothiol-dependent enzyme [Micromonospora sp. RTP1Z1]
MTTPADQTIAALRSGHDELAALVRGLATADLTRGSGASEWTIGQVLSHLGSGAEIGLAVLEAAVTGGAAPDGEFNQKVWARWDAMTPAEQADGFRYANEQLVLRYESLDAATREGLRVNLGFLPEPVDVAIAAAFRLSEFAHHQWDVEVGYNQYAALAPEAVPVLLDRLPFLLGFIGRPDALGGRHATLAVDLSNPDRSFGLELGEKIALTDAPEQPDGTLRAPAEAWLRLATGRLAAAHTPDTVTVTGPVDLDDLRRVFPGF